MASTISEQACNLLRNVNLLPTGKYKMQFELKDMLFDIGQWRVCEWRTNVFTEAS